MSSNEPTEPGTPPAPDMDEGGHRLHELPSFAPPSVTATVAPSSDFPTVEGVQTPEDPTVASSSQDGPSESVDALLPASESPEEAALEDALQDAVAGVIAEADALGDAGADAARSLDEKVPSVTELEGVLVGHGKAPLNHEKGARETYYVSVSTPEGLTRLWGEDLERAVTEQGAAIGQRVRLQYAGSAPVAMSVPELDGKGRVIGQSETKAMRNAWALTVLPALERSRTPTTPEFGAPIPVSKTSTPDAREEAFMATVNDILRGAAGVQSARPVMASPAAAPGTLAAVPLTDGQVRTGISGAIQGAAATVSEIARGAIGVAGAAGASAVRAVNDIVREASQGRGRTVLPRLGDYRVEQLERHAQGYGEAQEQLWNATPRLLALRNEITERARVTGASVPDVVEKMRPGGEFANLGERFCAAVSESPDATSHKKAMDKALDGFTKQYVVACEEQLNPEVAQSEMQQRLAERVEHAREKMEASAGTVPPFGNPSGGVESSHLERLREAIEKIVEKIKEFAEQIRGLFRGKREGAEVDSPTP